MQKKYRNSRGKSRPMETHFYPIDFFFLSLVFSYEHAEKFPAFFLCLLSISRIMNAKKNSKFEREDKSNGNTLVPHTFFFFLSLDCSYEHSERFPTFFFDALLVFVQYWKQKNLQMSSTSLDFRGNSQIFVIDTKFSRAPNFSVHQIIACLFTPNYRDPPPKHDNLERDNLVHAIIKWFTVCTSQLHWTLQPQWPSRLQ